MKQLNVVLSLIDGLAPGTTAYTRKHKLWTHARHKHIFTVRTSNERFLQVLLLQLWDHSLLGGLLELRIVARQLGSQITGLDSI